MSESRVRRLYANATAWNFGDHDDRPDLARMRDNAYGEFDRVIAKVKADALREAAGDLIRDAGLIPMPNLEHPAVRELWARADRIEGEA